MTNDNQRRDAPFQYAPDHQGGGLRFAWHGGEYIDVYFAGADDPHAVINTTPSGDDWDGTTPWFSDVEKTQPAFEAACEEWMREADPTEIAWPVPHYTGEITPEERAHLSRALTLTGDADADAEACLEELNRYRAARRT